MELRQLESFREVVRQGSFTAAARKLHMTQPAVSLHIKALEKYLKARLLDRDSKGVRVTAPGRVLLATADAVLGALDEAERRIAEIEAPERGTVRLACGDTVAMGLLPPVLVEFGRAFPYAELQIANKASVGVIEQVLAREVDLGIVTRPAWLDPALQARTLHIEHFRLALPKGHRLARKRNLTLGDLSDEPAVFLSPDTETRKLVERGLSKERVRLRVVLESGNLEVVKHYVRQGAGLSILPDLALVGDSAAGLVLRDLPSTFPQRRVALVRHKDSTASPLVKALLRIVAEHFKALES